MHELTVKKEEVNQLKPFHRNARTHSKKQIQQIARSIETFGFLIPIIIDQEKTIVAGHARVLAAHELKLATIPAIQVEHLSEPQIRAFVLADNKIAQNAGWDMELLKIELEYLTQIEIDIDVDLTGFAIPEVDIILGAANDDFIEETTLPPTPDLVETTSRANDLWQLGSHRLICGDCRKPNVIDQLMDGKEAKMVITDPPYNVEVNGHVCGLGKHQHNEFSMASGEMSSEEFTQFLSQSLGQLSRVSQAGSLHYVFMDWRHMQELVVAGNEIYSSMINLCVWSKTNGGMGSLYRSQHELVFLFKKGNEPHLNNIELGKHGRYRTNVWTYGGVNAFGHDRDEALSMHPTVKPTQLVADAILDVTKRSDIVLDGFLGSGTTIMAAEQTGRIAYGIEFDPRYVDVALRRWMELTHQEPIHIQTGKTFSELTLIRRQSDSGEV